LRRQRLGLFASGDATSVQVPVSLGEIAVFAHHAGYASYYQVIDTRDAERFRFVLQEPGSMRISVLDMGGQPKAGVAVWWVNRAAPLSISQTSTNGEGLVQQGDLTPGTFILRVGGFAPREIQVAENEETETIFREGIDP
jgi:hypothetical protein